MIGLIPAASIIVAAPDAGSASTSDIIAAGISLNGVARAPAIILRRGEHFYIDLVDAQVWRLVVDPKTLIDHDNRRWVPIDRLPGARLSFSESDQRLSIELAQQAFATQQLDAAPKAPSVAEAPLALFANYDVNVEGGNGGFSGNALGEAGLSGQFGAIASSWLWSSVANGGIRRLASSWTVDDPARQRRLVIGDAISRPSFWGGAARFAGVQYGTDFGIAPDLVTFPVPRLAGVAGVPSTVDLLVDQGLRYRGAVDAGPFTIDGVPVTSGAHRAVLLVRDAFGGEQSVTVPYYASAALLRPGLVDFGIEGGWERRDIATSTDRYTNPFVAVGARIGVTSQLTVQMSGQARSDGLLVAGAASTSLGGVAEMTVGVAQSESAGKAARLYSVTLVRRAPNWSFGIAVERREVGFAELGRLGEAEQVDRVLADSSVNTPVGRLAIAYARTVNGPDTSFSLATATLSYPVSRRLNLALFGQRVTQGERESLQGSLTLSLSWGRNSLFASAASDGSRVEFQRSPQLNGPLGLRAGLVDGVFGPGAVAEATRWSGQGDTSLAVTINGRGPAARFSASGGVLATQGMIAAVRRVDQGFAVVDAGGAAGLPIYNNGQLVARTNRHGRAIIPNLLAYQHNRISFDPADLPIDTNVTSGEADVTPGYRKGAMVRLGIRKSRTLLVTALDPRGQPLPIGSRVILPGGGETIVGRDGLLFVGDFISRATLVIESDADSRCILTLPASAPEGMKPIQLQCRNQAT
ncbi:fimbria/pilus outer membrane usher protein [Sphingomonas sp. GlSt437]|uniref:fimbria/pilus outer membrane usher protein n=1 Tax=Sphingomonas sp. GlSt437 TaxID=3389970 RepID=UPI003EBB3200